MQETLSVVVPVYNVEAYLPRCLASILAQTFAPSEIILVDDGSTDKCGTICDAYAKAYPQVRALHQRNQGSSAARNAGLAAATGDWVAFVDADDYLAPEMYAVLLTRAQQTRAQISIGGTCVEQVDGDVRQRQPRAVEKTWDTEEALVELNSFRYFDMSFCDKVFVRKLFDGLAFPVGKKCEDYFLMHRVIARAGRLTYTSQPLYYYYQRPGSNSRGAIHLDSLEASQAQLTFFRGHFPHLSYAAETACAFSQMAVYNAFARARRPFPAGLAKRLQRGSRKYLRSVLHNRRLPAVKKAQACVFACSLPLYQQIVTRRAHR